MAIHELKVPPIGESINEVTLSRWLVDDGAVVALDQPICEFDSDKATLEFPCEVAGKISRVASEGDDLPIGGLVARIDTDHAPVVKKEIAKPILVPQREAPPASPAASKILRESGIPGAEVSGTGKQGRITKADAMQASAKLPSPEPEPPLPAVPVPTIVSNPSFSRNTRREKMSRMRRTISRRLVSARNNTAMLTTFNEVDMTNILNLRKTYNEAYEKKHGVKIGFMSIFAKACSQALMEMPGVNAHIDGEDLIYHEFADISIAISTPSGLVVPPIRNVESLSLHEFEKQLKVLAEKARTGTLSLEEMTGGTFTITNGGIFGSLMSTPILNEPQSAILGMHAIVERPVGINGQVVLRPMMYLALSYDHRVIDGSSSVTFLVRVKELLEDPLKLFIGL
jgi:2-oxoglutarate dehydrogenase E2 component (dihydrolipoamide succinyltransferase)